MEIPVIVVSAVDPVLRDTATAALLCDLPYAVVLRYDVQEETLHRVVATSGEHLATAELPLGHCLTCTVREDLHATIVDLYRSGPPQLVVAPPLTMDPVPIAHAVSTAAGPAVLASSLVALDPADLEQDLLGDDLLVERGLGFGERDRRSVGEVMARQLETADLLALATLPERTPRSLLDHLVGEVPGRTPLHLLGAETFARRRPVHFPQTGDLRRCAPTGAPDRAGVWTLDLHSHRPLHPERLREQAGHLAGPGLRGRGYFWLPTRPGARCAWDGAGGQLAIGDLDRWPGSPSTRLIVTGVGRDPAPVAAAFATALVSDVELADLRRWRDLDDGLDEWLGPRLDPAHDPAGGLLPERPGPA
ncbi:MAG: GTP-binding protein [Sporichthyaceae bacterium]